MKYIIGVFALIVSALQVEAMPSGQTIMSDSVPKNTYVQYLSNGKCGICINTMDEILIPAQYEYVSPEVYDVNLFLARKNGKYGYLDFQSAVVIPFQYSGAMEFKEGLAAVIGSNGGYGYINPYNELVIESTDVWTDVSLFDNGEAWVRVADGRYYIIDTRGSYINSKPFTEIEYLGNHRYKVTMPVDADGVESRKGIFTVGQGMEWDE